MLVFKVMKKKENSNNITSSWDNSNTLPAVSTTISTLPFLLAVVRISAIRAKDIKARSWHLVI